MRLFTLIAVLAALALPAGAATLGTARVAVLDTSPFTVHGWRFVGGEHVTVVVTVKGRYVHHVTASAAGRFTTRFTRVTLGYCEQYAVRATGDRGSTAFFKIVPDCPPPPAPLR